MHGGFTIIDRAVKSGFVILEHRLRVAHGDGEEEGRGPIAGPGDTAGRRRGSATPEGAPLASTTTTRRIYNREKVVVKRIFRKLKSLHEAFYSRRVITDD